jgi:hypothetical protein
LTIDDLTLNKPVWSETTPLEQCPVVIGESRGTRNSGNIFSMMNFATDPNKFVLKDIKMRFQLSGPNFSQMAHISGISVSHCVVA